MSSSRSAKLLALKQREDTKWKTGRLEGSTAQKFIAKYGTSSDNSPSNKLISTLVKQHFQQDGDPNSKDLDARIRQEVSALKSRLALRKHNQSLKLSTPESRNLDSRNMSKYNTFQQHDKMPEINMNKLSSRNNSDNRVDTTRTTNRLSTNRSNNNNNTHNEKAVYQNAKSNLATDWSLLNALTIIESEDEIHAKKIKELEKRANMKKDLEAGQKLKEQRKQLIIEEERKELQKSLENDAKIEEELKQKLKLKQELLKREKIAFEEIANKRAYDKKKAIENKANSERIEMERIKKEQENDKIKAKQRVLKEKERLEKELQDALKDKANKEIIKLNEAKIEIEQAKAHQVKLDNLLKQRSIERQRKLDHAFDCALISESPEWQSCMNDIPIRKRKDSIILLERSSKQQLELEEQYNNKMKNENEKYRKEQERIYYENMKLVEHRNKVKKEEFNDTIRYHNMLERKEQEAAEIEAKELQKKKEERVAHMKGLANQVELNRKMKKNYNMTDAERQINISRISKLENIAQADPQRVSEVLQHFPQKGSHQASLKR